MTKLLEIKELIESLYIRFERIIVPVSKFILAWMILSKVNGFIGQFDVKKEFTLFDATSIKFGVAAIVAFVPWLWFVLLLIVIVSGHLFFVSIEASIIAFCVMVVVYLMFIRLFPKQAYLVLAVPLLLSMKLAYVMPLLAGLLIGPMAIVPVGVGVFIYFSVAYLPGLLEIKAADLYAMPQALIAMYKYVLNVLVADRGMILMIAVFVVVIIVTYYVSRLEIEYAQYIAIGVGGMVNIFGFIIGNVVLNAGVSIGGVFIGTIFAVALVGVVQFFRFSLNYQKTERQQFEDDDYYYYVKAIPKIKVTRSKKEIKKIE